MIARRLREQGHRHGLAGAVRPAVRQDTALLNQIRVFCENMGSPRRLEYGRWHGCWRTPWPTASLVVLAYALLVDMREGWQWLNGRIRRLDRELNRTCRDNEPMRRLIPVPGIGPLTATALVAAITDGSAFKRGRDLAAWLGLVPKQWSTGGRTRLFGISKRGNSYRLFKKRPSFNKARRSRLPIMVGRKDLHFETDRCPHIHHLQRGRAVHRRQGRTSPSIRAPI
jgi:transposase